MMKPAHNDYSYSPDPRLEKAIDIIREKYPSLWPDGTRRLAALLHKLGDPHLRLPPVFHAAGTNGKGSTLAFVEAIFNAGGKRVHKFVSPHLVRFEERIVINGKEIDSGDLVSLVAEVDKAASEIKPSFFEFITAMGFLAFSRHPAAALLLETGLGGRDDATNVILINACAILTRISFDHTHVLGDTLPAIAWHKAGIIKKGCPVVIAPQADDAVTEVFKTEAAAQNAAITAWKISTDENGFDYEDDEIKIRLPLPALLGRHQLDNAGTAIAAMRAGGFGHLLTPENLEKAMRQVRWPGRLQKLAEGNLVSLLPQGWELWVDGSHNDSGAETLVAALREWDALPLHILTAFKRKKDAAGFYRPLAPVTKTIQAVNFPIALPMAGTDELQGLFERLGFAGVSAAESLEAALEALAFQFQGPQRIVMTGSLYLAGHALRRNA